MTPHSVSSDDVLRMRNARDLSQDGFAGLIGYTGGNRRATIAKWERGENIPPHMKLLLWFIDEYDYGLDS